MQLGWHDHRLPGVVMAARVGYGQLSQREDSPYRQIPADEFIDELVAMLTSAHVVPPVRQH